MSSSLMDGRFLADTTIPRRGHEGQGSLGAQAPRSRVGAGRSGIGATSPLALAATSKQYPTLSGRRATAAVRPIPDIRYGRRRTLDGRSPELTWSALHTPNPTLEGGVIGQRLLQIEGLLTRIGELLDDDSLQECTCSVIDHVSVDAVIAWILDKARAKHPDMVLLHGGSPKGAERVAPPVGSIITRSRRSSSRPTGPSMPRPRLQAQRSDARSVARRSRYLLRQPGRKARKLGIPAWCRSAEGAA
jgi:hypothetical protein